MKERDGASFRDPDGFVYHEGGTLLRQVNLSYKENYDMFMGSGLYAGFLGEGILVRHEETAAESGAYKTLKPEVIPFISYPYEWSFQQLKDAALLTLKIQKACLEKGMSLKDASAYNVQFRNGAPVFIDILSFEKYPEGEPWVAYGQFCRHFLAPLSLAAKKDQRLFTLMKEHLDGIPLDLVSGLLSWKTYFNPGLLLHIHLHAMSVGRYSGKSIKQVRRGRLDKFGLLGIIESLRAAVEALKEGRAGGHWSGYYDDTNYSAEAFGEKKRIVSEYLGKVPGKGILWDLGANTGEFGRIASEKGFTVVSFDLDPAAIGISYGISKKNPGKYNVLPLVMDFFNPSPALGWAEKERKSLLQRGPCGCVMALALIHHLALANNLPLGHIASFFSEITRGTLILEFVPPEDSRAKPMAENNPVLAEKYNERDFISAFEKFFTVEARDPVRGSLRTLYFMTKKQ
jgi:ribosomal protein L11 methylase PrmA